MLQVMDEWTNHGKWRPTLAHTPTQMRTHPYIQRWKNLIAPVNRLFRQHRLGRAAGAFDWVRHAWIHTHALASTRQRTHQQTPVQVITPVFMCLLFTVRHSEVLRATLTLCSLFHAMSPVLHITESQPANCLAHTSTCCTRHRRVCMWKWYGPICKTMTSIGKHVYRAGLSSLIIWHIFIVSYTMTDLLLPFIFGPSKINSLEIT